MLIAIFAAVSMVFNFIFNKIEIQVTREVFNQFTLTYPEESQAFRWAFDSSPNFDFLSYIVIGVLTFVIILIIIIAFNKLEGRQLIADFANIFTYLFLFIVFSYFFSPLIFNRPVNIIWAFGYALVTGASSHLLLLHNHLRQKRRNIGSNSGDQFPNLDFIRQSLDLEHVEYRSVLHDIIWVCVSLSVGLFLGTTLQYLFALPMEISLSNIFGRYMIVPFAQFVILIIGVFLGIIFQLMLEIHDIVDLTRENTKLVKPNMEKNEEQ